MSEFLDSVLSWAEKTPDAVAYENTKGERLTYGQLAQKSAALACYLQNACEEKAPVILYGHKGAAMVVGMFACMRSGHAYVPIDVSFPATRIQLIVNQLPDVAALCTEPVGEENPLASLAGAVSPEGLEEICAEPVSDEALAALRPISGDDGQYILFTSGSTGTPKGVVQRAESIDLTSRYFRTLLPEGEGLVCFNRAPFSFDLSIFDFLMALPCGHTMFSLEKNVEESLAQTFDALAGAGVNVWVSTPSFLNMCLTDPSFSPELLPQVKVFIMCGETLHNATAATCLQRFCEASLVNMYGPTETCGAVTHSYITADMAADPAPLPVGRPSAYSQIVIADPETLQEVPAGERGEILILGNTAAAGYYGDEEKTKAAFFLRENARGELARCYRTGDEGYLDDQGVLQYCGRFDLQLKVGGYRIELGDIEENLASLPQVAACCVLPVSRNGMVSSLCAHVVPEAGIAGDRHLTKALKEALKELLPAYMIPRTFAYHQALPTNVNGKVDRKALAAESDKPSARGGAAAAPDAEAGAATARNAGVGAAEGGRG
ncbi:MAG: amino acid adenylation domain-containing protein [Eggerthellales bacterium]|nr:amino acid adenylation domain-containing protein [Eggerthellales bacterium]